MAKGGKKSGAKKTGAKKSTKKALSARGKKTATLRAHATLSSYVRRINKAAGKHAISKKAVAVLNSFALDMFDRIATLAGAVTRGAKGKTLKSSAVQTAVRMALPADLAKHSISEASKAVAAYAKIQAAKPKSAKSKKVAKK